MNLLLIVAILFSNIITKTIPNNETLLIDTDGVYEIVYTSSTRVVVETTYSNDAPVALQEYIKKRYSIESIENKNVTQINIKLPKTELIYKGKKIQESLSSVIYVPKGTKVF